MYTVAWELNIRTLAVSFLLPSNEPDVVGGVCAGTHKTFACARVSDATPLCVLLRALISYQTHTWHSAFFCQTRVFFRWGNTHDPESKSAVETQVPGEECAAAAAGQGSLCEVSALGYFFVVCSNFHAAAAAASLRVRLKFWDIWHISHFPAAALLIQGLVCLAGSSSFIYSPLVLYLLRLFRRLSDLGWSLLRYY